MIASSSSMLSAACAFIERTIPGHSSAEKSDGSYAAWHRPHLASYKAESC